MFDHLTNKQYSKKKLHTFVISLRLHSAIWTERRWRRKIQPMWVVVFFSTHNVVQYLSKGHVTVCSQDFLLMFEERYRDLVTFKAAVTSESTFQYFTWQSCVLLCFVFSQSSGDVMSQENKEMRICAAFVGNTTLLCCDLKLYLCYKWNFLSGITISSWNKETSWVSVGGYMKIIFNDWFCFRLNLSQRSFHAQFLTHWKWRVPLGRWDISNEELLISETVHDPV